MTNDQLRAIFEGKEPVPDGIEFVISSDRYEFVGIYGRAFQRHTQDADEYQTRYEGFRSGFRVGCGMAVEVCEAHAEANDNGGQDWTGRIIGTANHLAAAIKALLPEGG